VCPCPLVSEAFYRCLHGGIDDDWAKNPGLGVMFRWIDILVDG
jgi:hypothetical protein